MRSTIQHIGLVLLFLTVPGFLLAQNWQQKMIEKKVSLSEVQSSFEDHWQNKPYEKGKGYKQFKRWEHFNQSRLFGMDHFPNPDITWKAIKKLELNKPNSSSRSVGDWQPMGPTSWVQQAANPGLGRINVIAVSPSDPNKIFVGAPAGGLWVTEDGGNTWSPKTDFLMSIGISAILINPNNENEMYIGTGDGDGADTYSIGVLKSIDGGETWEETGLVWETVETHTIRAMVMHPTDTDIILAATNNGVYKSEDAGASWINTQTGSFHGVVYHPTDPNIVYACTNRFYKSIDGGNSFTWITSGLPDQTQVLRYRVAVSLDEPDWVYLIAGDDAEAGFLGLYRSQNSGDNFNLQSNSPNVLGWNDEGLGSGGQAWYDLALAVSPLDAENVHVGGVNSWRSSDGGVNWEITSHWIYGNSIGYNHADIHYLVFHENKLYCGSDGGIFESSDNGNNWVDRSEGLGITQFYRLGLSATNPNLIIGGTQDNGTFFFNGTDWIHILGADGMECFIHPTDIDIMVGSIYTGFLQVTYDGGNDWEPFTPPLANDESGAWVTPFVNVPGEPNQVIAGYENVYKYDNGWSVISDFGGGTFNALHVPQANNNYIYASKDDVIWKTTNDGGNWINISDGLPSLYISYIETDPTNENIVYVTLSGYSDGNKVFKSTDGGDSWENITLNIPNIPVNCIAFEENSNEGLYIGTDIGVFYRDLDVPNWTPFMDGLPNVIVNELEIHNAAGKIRAATYGRGIWESTLFNGFNQPPTANFSADRLTICEGESVSFTDLSIGNESNWSWTFEGGSPDTSDEQSPEVSYNQVGFYDVSLVVSNSFGQDSITKTSYIQVIPYTGESTPFIEGFEDAPIPNSEWYVDNPSGPGWETNTSVSHTDNASVWLDNYNNSGNQTDELISSTIDLSNAQEVLMTFYVAYAQKSAQDNDQLSVFISKDCGETWLQRKVLFGSTTLNSAIPTNSPFTPLNDEWNFVELTNIIQTYWVENFMVKFIFESDGGNNVYLDDINITDASGNANLIAQNLNMVLFPNPTKDVSNLGFNLIGTHEIQISISDILGRTIENIYSGNLGFGYHEMQINTSQLAKGTYLINLTIDGKEFTKKFVKD